MSTADATEVEVKSLTLSTKQRDFAYPPDQHQQQPQLDNDNDHDGSHSFSDTTATNSSDEFDWNDDDENLDHSALQRTSARRGRALYLAFMKLARPIRTLLVGILGSGLLIVPLIVVQFKVKDDPVRLQVHVWSLWSSIVWAAGCVTYILVDSIPRLVLAVTALFGGHVERLKTKLELCFAVSGWMKLVLDVVWAWIALALIRAFYPSQFDWSGDYLNRVMKALLSVSLILLVEKLFLHFVAINFHKKALADRLHENRLGLKALDRISNAPPAPRKFHSVRKGYKSPPGGPSSRHPSVDLSTMPHEMLRNTSERGRSHKHHTLKLNEGTRMVKGAAGVIVDSVGGAIWQVALKDSKFNREGMGSLHSARKLARKLFSALSDVSPPRSYLIVEDFYPYFRSTVEAHEAFELFDKDKNGDISKKEMREAVQRIYRERKALISSLKDVSSAVAKLDAVLLAVALIVAIFVCLLIFRPKDTLASLVPLATIVLGFSFIFGHSAQTLFESLIFIFSTHVFDVGDLVMIDDQPLLVKEFGLFSTTFRRVDGQEIIAPNALLASTKLVHNLRRSTSMWESTNIMVSYQTSMEVIDQLRSKISFYVAQNNRDWRDGSLHIDKMEYQNAIHLIVAMEHRPNWQDWGGRWTRRTAFMRNLKTILEELDVKYTMPVQPVLLPNAPLSGNFSSRVGPPPSPATALGRKKTTINSGMFQGGDVRIPMTSG